MINQEDHRDRTIQEDHRDRINQEDHREQGSIRWITGTGSIRITKDRQFRMIKQIYMVVKIGIFRSV